MVIDFQKVLKKRDKLKKKKVRKDESKQKKSLRKVIKTKGVLKPSRATLVIKQREQASVMDEPSRFFKDEMEEVKKTMFFR